MDFRLVKPALSMEQEYTGYIVEWESTCEKIVPYASKRNGEDYASLLARWEIDSTEKAYENGFVPATILFMTNEAGRIFGIIHIRHVLNDLLFMYGGHIGYGVRPSERKKGIAKRMLAMALPIAKELGINRALLTCDKNNIASASTIIANGGIFENEVPGEGRITQRYWIEI